MRRPPSPGRIFGRRKIGGSRPRLTFRSHYAPAHARPWGEFLVSVKRGGGRVFRNRKKGAVRRILDALEAALAIVMFVIVTLVWT